MPRDCAVSTICARFAFNCSTGRPRSPSFPPRATISTLTLPSSAQSRRDSPPADVSPDTPALTTSKSRPSVLRRCWSRDGYDCSTGSPRPAVRLSPRITIRGASPREDPGFVRSPAPCFGDRSAPAAAREAGRDSSPRSSCGVQPETNTRIEAARSGAKARGRAVILYSRWNAKAAKAAEKIRSFFASFASSAFDRGVRLPIQLRFQRGDGLLQHFTVRRRSRGGEIGGRPGERELDGAALRLGVAFVNTELRSQTFCALSFGLLILDVFALEPTCHT